MDLVIAHDRVSEKTLVEPCAQMKRNGYAIIPEVLNCTEAEELLSKLEASQLQRSRAGVRHLLGHPVVSAVANDPRLLGLAQEILGDQAFPFRATLFDKSPDANWLITWHQDTALPLREKVDAAGWGPWSVKEGVIYAHAPAAALERVVALRLHLDDSTAANGPLRIIPETHCRGVLSDSAVETIVAQEPGVTCMVEKGGIIAMKPLAIHASSKSQAEIPRRVLHIEYATNTAVSAPLQLANCLRSFRLNPLAPCTSVYQFLFMPSCSVAPFALQFRQLSSILRVLIKILTGMVWSIAAQGVRHPVV